VLAHDALRDGGVGVVEMFGQVHIRMNVPKQRQPKLPCWSFPLNNYTQKIANEINDLQ
jgi:hypothetical protein